VHSIEKPDSVMNLVHTMGGRHEIYGVNATDYREFADAMCDTIEAVLGKKECGADTKEAWFKVMIELSTVMLDSAKNIKLHGYTGIVLRKIGNQSWKKSFVRIDLEMVNLFKDAKPTDLKVCLSFSDVLDISENDGTVDIPDDNKFLFLIKSGYSPNLAFAFPTQSEMRQWLDEFSWRILAVQRVFRDDEETITSPKKVQSKGLLKWKKNIASKLASITPPGSVILSPHSSRESTKRASASNSISNTGIASSGVCPFGSGSGLNSNSSGVSSGLKTSSL